VESGIPRTRYAKAADGTHLAYQVFGAGEEDLLYVSGGYSHLDVVWEFSPYARFMRRLGDRFRVITFDKRGTGLSDRIVRVPDLETLMDDVRAVLDAAGSQRAVLLGLGPTGGGACAVFAASFPERTCAFIWWGAEARWVWAPDYPWGDREEDIAEEDWAEEDWGDDERGGELLRSLAGPSSADDPEAQRWFTRFLRYAAGPGDVEKMDRLWSALDVRSALPAVHVPTLCVPSHLPEGPEETAWIAGQIPGAVCAALHPTDYPPWLGDLNANLRVIEDFLESVQREEKEFDRVLATVLFTDVVGSTDRAAAVGDRAWRGLVDRHDAVIRGLLARYRGNEVKTTSDGFLATFDGPARAVKCAEGICHAMRPLGLEVRAGCHCGEIELLDGDVGGLAVHIAARVAALAGPGEVLVSSTVKDLVIGSGLAFSERGEHELKGVPGSWRLYAAA